ncbi:pyrroloquinoline quinone biosynthesis protein B [Thermomonospora echinospora]|uniref:Coenzyme PQQ synthesis protein B n=1 Tax=Thermomonospora echinospora TaxID=1992 RepID=A0A1H6C372_9ACTN|nr:pyrroloquinoline quinone biosynthesis protein PqqB [Thermomonospora echinospora]SEG67401.1 pyrroloquinoline quinone biosynthesis protein B [Thermomonospora echinospora]
MKIRVLGTAAGGGSPQWNCSCVQCARARRAGPPSWRTQDSLAVSGTGDTWYLVNASPDVRAQILLAPELTPRPGTRETPLRGVLLSSAELDHTIGLAVLREGAPLNVYAPPAVIGALSSAFPLRDVLAPYADHRWHAVEPGDPLRLDERLVVTAVSLGDKRPRYARGLPGRDWVVAYSIEDEVTGRRLVYAPNLASWPEEFDKAAAGADVLIADGTFWSDDELRRATRTPPRTAPTPPRATVMGHLPVAGPGGVGERLAALPGGRRLLTHLNNTNPLLDATSDQSLALASSSVEVAADGMVLEL